MKLPKSRVSLRSKRQVFLQIFALPKAIIVQIGLLSLSSAAMLSALLFFTALLPIDNFSTPISGALSSYGLNKNADYAFVAALCVLPVFFFWLFGFISINLIEKTTHKESKVVSGFLNLLLSPLAGWLCLSMFGNPKSYLVALGFPVLMAVSAGLYVVFKCRKSEFQTEVFLSSLKRVLVILVGSVSSSWGFFVASLQLNQVGGPSISTVGAAFIAICGLLATSLMGILAILGQASNSEVDLRSAALSAAGVPLGLAVFVPAVLAAGGAPTLYGLLTCLLILTYSVLTRVVFWTSRSLHFGGFVLKGWLIAIASMSLTFSTMGPAQISEDDYHFGEFVTIWRSLVGGQIPFVDIDPPRGLINYLPGLLTDVFYDGQFSLYSYSFSLWHLFILLALTPMLVKVIGAVPTSLAVMVYPLANGLNELDLIGSSLVLAVFLLLKSRRPQMALPVYLVLSYFLFLLSPAHGLIYFSVPLLPMLWFIKVHWRDVVIRRQALQTVLAGVAALALLPNLYLISRGAIEYLVDQSFFNSSAYGISWLVSIPSAPGDPILFEASRAIGLLLLPALIVWLLTRQERAKERVYWVAGLIVGVGLLYFKAVGRIDPAAPSRLGSATLIIICIVLPVLFSVAVKSRSSWLAGLSWLLALAMMAGLYPKEIYSATDFLRGTGNRIVAAVPAEVRVPEPDTNLLPRGFRSVAMSDEKRKEIQGLRSVLEHYSITKNGFLDLTNRSANYAYLDQLSPIPSPAIYNLVTPFQQRRAIAHLKSKDIEIVLVGSNIIQHDGLSGPLRSPILFQYLDAALDNFSMITDGNNYLLVAPHIFSSSKTPTGYKLLTAADKNTELGTFWSAQHLAALPFSWGSIELATSLEKYEIIGLDERLGFDGQNSVAPTRFVYKKLRKAEAPVLSQEKFHILSFDLACENGSIVGHDIRVSWGANDSGSTRQISFTGRGGLAAVPLYASYGWDYAVPNSFVLEVSRTCVGATIAEVAISPFRF